MRCHIDTGTQRFLSVCPPKIAIRMNDRKRAEESRAAEENICGIKMTLHRRAGHCRIVVQRPRSCVVPNEKNREME